MPRTTLSPSDRAQMVRRCRAALLDCEVIIADWKKRFPHSVREEVLATMTSDEKMSAAMRKHFGDFAWLGGHPSHGRKAARKEQLGEGA